MGVSTKLMAIAAAAFESRSVESGSAVEQSAMIKPFLPWAKSPLSPKTISSTCGVPVTTKITMSDCAAISARLLHS